VARGEKRLLLFERAVSPGEKKGGEPPCGKTQNKPSPGLCPKKGEEKNLKYSTIRGKKLKKEKGEGTTLEGN